MGIFQEYLDSKGKVETGKVDVSGDRTDPMTPPTKPPKEHSSKKPYISDGKKFKGEKGFGDMGDKDMKYDPCCDGGKGKKPAKIPTAEQAFAELELIPLVTEAVTGNPEVLEKVVIDLKKNGQLGALVAEVLSHRESYNHIASIMEDETYGPEVCKKMTRAMKSITEEVDAPFHKAAELEDDEAADMDSLENQDGQDEEGLDDDMASLDMDMGGEDQDYDDIESAVEGEPPMNSDPSMGDDSDPLMNANPEMAQFQKAFQRSYQKHFQRKMMSAI